VSASPIRRRATRALLVAGLSLTLLAGCTTTQRDARNYKDTEKHFLEGCATRAAEDNEAKGTQVEIASPKAWCQCVFDAIEKDVPFEDFRKANSDLRDGEGDGTLPKEIQKAYDSCDPAMGA